ncbi:hypothetical protein BX666DRAFT_1863959 [Dichotomocladium elegans]|nr:hypothetical protein BX666DRAFT_1863959 [Dichotomocladium elegans]
MEAIDDYANENIARSLAYTVLEYRQQRNYEALLPLMSKLLRHRVRYLANSDSKKDEWDSVVQWQTDDCPDVIESEWDAQDGGPLYRSPVYYKRLDAETLHCMLEFAAVRGKRYAVVLVLEEGAGDISDLKYHNTKSFSDAEWRKDIAGTWSESLEQAERDFMVPASPEARSTGGGHGHEAPDGYWGDWTSSEGEDTQENSIMGSKRGGHERKPPASGTEGEEDDSEDEYYTRWSHNPGTITPGLDEKQQHRHSQEIQEEYDTSFNPLYTVPSVPDLMGLHTSALQELTQMLHSSLPNPTGSKPTIPSVDPVPKIIRSRENSLPGAFPLDDNQQTTSRPVSYGHDAGRMLLEKSLRALVGVARMVGIQGSEVLDIVKQILNDENQHTQ